MRILNKNNKKSDTYCLFLGQYYVYPKRRKVLATDFEELYVQYGSMVMRRCRQLLRNEEQALDAMQDVFVKVLRKGTQWKMKSPPNLLYTMATNHCLNIMNREKKMSGDPSVLEFEPGRESTEEKVLDRMFLDMVFETQKESTRTIAYLHYRDGLTLEETAHVVGLSVSGVRRRLRKLREVGWSLKGEGNHE
jgi:RNA polymerase sigma-70 factor, ECF subfamily